MAVRKETIRTQFTEALGPVLEPGEQVVAGAVTQSGHSPWLTSAFGALGYLIFMAFGTRLYFMAVTDRRVVLIKASILRGRPAGIRFNFHRKWRDELQVIVKELTSARAEVI